MSKMKHFIWAVVVGLCIRHFHNDPPVGLEQAPHSRERLIRIWEVLKSMIDSNDVEDTITFYVVQEADLDSR